jgi:hypothetical protein
LSLNSSQLNAAGTAPLIRNNAACTVRAIARTTSGTQSASGTTNLAINNPDMILATAAFPRTASDLVARVWYGGQDAAVTVTVRPILFSGRTAVSANVQLTGTGKSGTATTSPFVVSFPTSSTSTDPNSLFGLTVTGASVRITVLDNQGNTITGSPFVGGNPMIVTFASTTPSATATPPGQVPTSGFFNGTFNTFNLDVQNPPVASMNINFNSQNATNGYIGSGFSFATSSQAFFASALNTASTLNSLGWAQTSLTGVGSDCINVATATAIANGTLCDNGGVDKVTLVTSFTTSNPATSSSTFTTFTANTAIPESGSGTAYGLRIQACDALNNCASTGVTQLGRFGIDLTVPSLTQVTGSGPTNNAVYRIGDVVPGAITFTVSDPQGAGGVPGSGAAAPASLLVTLQALQPSGTSSSATNCIIGQLPAGATSGACANSITSATLVGSGGPINGQASLTGTTIALPTAAGEYTLTVRGLDQAGNQSTVTTIRWYVDQAAPTVASGVAVPASIVGGTTFSVAASDNMDVAAGNGYLRYAVGGAIYRFFEAGTAAPVGATFDNALTRSSTITVPLATWFRSLTGALGTAGVKPDSLGLRALDAATNLSLPELVALPPLNIADGSTISNTSATNGVTNITIAAAPNPIWAGGTTTTNPGTTTLTATVRAISLTSTTPFSQYCFYYANPNGTQGGAAGVNNASLGNLVQIGCTSAVATTGDGTVKDFVYTQTFTPAVALGGNALLIYAVGVTSNTDAIITAMPGSLQVNVLP